MKFQRLCSVAIAATTVAIALNATPTYSQSEPNKVTFLCRNVKDSASGEKIPTTVAWIPERQAYVQIVGWKSDYFKESGWDGARRCQTVTPKFQKFYDEGNLKYLTAGDVKDEEQAICAIRNPGEQCNETNQLFTIKPHEYSDVVLERLMGVLKGKYNQPFYQSSGDQTYVSVNDYFRKTVAIDSAMMPN